MAESYRRGPAAREKPSGIVRHRATPPDATAGPRTVTVFSFARPRERAQEGFFIRTSAHFAYAAITFLTAAAIWRMLVSAYVGKIKVTKVRLSCHRALGTWTAA